jgi:hypothetical protein
MSYIRDTISDEFTILRPDAFAYPVVGPPSHRKLWGAGLPMFDYSAQVFVPRTHVVANGGELVACRILGDQVGAPRRM